MRILLLCSAFNGLSQRAWAELRAAGHEVIVRLAVDDEAMRTTARTTDPDLIVCPFLRERVPTEVWTRFRTIIIHPGPVGDRGPSSLDWAITEDRPTWGVTALQAVDEMDAGPVWATRTFAMPSDPPRKSGLYNGVVTDAALAVIHDVVARATDPAWAPSPAVDGAPSVIGQARPLMRQADRAFSWSDTTDHIVRRIRAADGAPGIRATLATRPVSIFDAHGGPSVTAPPGTIVGRRHGAVLVATGDASVWIGHVKVRNQDPPAIKLPATRALAGWLDHVPERLEPAGSDGLRELTYHRVGSVGVVTFDFYNGAMSTGQCRRLAAALRHATAQDTRVLVLRGGATFSNGIHLNVIEAADDPAVEAWRNINAIDDVCREIIACDRQLVVTSIGGSAGAGGVMLALGADRVVARDGVVLNPHYATMGLYGSEYWTYVLPRRVGETAARHLTEACLPVDTAEAAAIGLVDMVCAGPRPAFEDVVVDYAATLATSDRYDELLATKRAALAADERVRPLTAYRARELREMRADMFEDRHGFQAARRAFVTKARPTAPDATPAARAGTPRVDDPRMLLRTAN